MATKKTPVTTEGEPEEVKEEIKLDLSGKAEKRMPSGGPFAPRRDGEPFEPATRLEAFLYAIAIGDPDACPEPATREELLLTGIAFAMSERET